AQRGSAGKYRSKRQTPQTEIVVGETGFGIRVVLFILVVAHAQRRTQILGDVVIALREDAVSGRSLTLRRIQRGSQRTGRSRARIRERQDIAVEQKAQILIVLGAQIIHAGNQFEIFERIGRQAQLLIQLIEI